MYLLLAYLKFVLDSGPVTSIGDVGCSRRSKSRDTALNAKADWASLGTLACKPSITRSDTLYETTRDLPIATLHYDCNAPLHDPVPWRPKP